MTTPRRKRTIKLQPEPAAVPEQEEVIEVTEPQQVSQVLDPTLLNPHSAQPVPGAGVKVKWDNPTQDPNNRLHIGDDPTGEKNAAKFDAG